MTRLVDPCLTRHLPFASSFPAPAAPRRVPPTLPLRPRSASEIVDAAFQLYRRDPLTYLLISAICYAPILVMQLVVFGPGMDVNEQLSSLTGGMIGLMILGYWVSVSLMSAVMIRLSAQDYLGTPIEPAVAVRDSFAKLPAVMFALLMNRVTDPLENPEPIALATQFVDHSVVGHAVQPGGCILGSAVSRPRREGGQQCALHSILHHLEIANADLARQDGD